MFDFEYKGANAVTITTKKVRVVFDPSLSSIGLKDVSVRDSYEIVTEADLITKGSDPKNLFDGPGEYEMGDVSIVGIAAKSYEDNEQAKTATIYKLLIGDIRLVVVGNVAPKLSDYQLENIGMVDVAVIPVGGNGHTLDSSSAAAMVRQLDSKAVIPVNFSEKTLDSGEPRDNEDRFVEELSSPVVEAGPKWRVKGPASIPEQMTVIKVSRSN